MQYRNVVVLCSIIATTVMGGCALTPGPGPVASDPPPQIVTSAFSNAKVWSHVGNFGPVPASLQAKGDELCQSVGQKVARGYHPQAKQLDGSTIPGGGFLCGS